MRIGALARKCSVTAETIRFYEAQGLLPRAIRTSNNYREYGQEHLLRLHFICHCRSLGMGLEAIKSLVKLDAFNPEEANQVHAMLDQELLRVEKQIESLKEFRSHLKALKARCSGHHEEGPCGILVGLTQDASCGSCTCRHKEN